MKLSELFPRIKELGDCRVVVTNGVAVAEFVSTLDNVSLGQRSWNFNSADHSKEFHLYKDKVKSVKFFYGEHPRFKRTLGQVDFLDDKGEVGMMVFLDPATAADPESGPVKALQALIAEFGENPVVEPDDVPVA